MRVVLGALLALFLLSGCAQRATVIPQITDPHVEVRDSALYEWLQFERVDYVRRSDNMLQFEASFYNASSAKQALAYRVDWYDENGFVIKTILSKWNIIHVEGYRNLVINGISPSHKTTDFKVRLQRHTTGDEIRQQYDIGQ